MSEFKPDDPVIVARPAKGREYMRGWVGRIDQYFGRQQKWDRKSRQHILEGWFVRFSAGGTVFTPEELDHYTRQETCSQ